MINIFFPVFDKIESWTGSFLPFSVQNLLGGIMTGIFTFTVYWLLSNQSSITEIKNEMKTIRKKMFESSLEDKNEYNSLAKKNLSLSFNYLGKIFTPAIISIIPVVIIILWYDINHSYSMPYENKSVAVTTIPNNFTITAETNDIISYDINGNIFLQPKNKSNEISIYTDDNLIYTGRPFTKPIPYLTKKKWWNILLSSPIGYLSRDSEVDVLIFHYSEKVLFKKLPHFINGWELLFFTGIFVTTLPLKFIFKVK